MIGKWTGEPYRHVLEAPLSAVGISNDNVARHRDDVLVFWSQGPRTNCTTRGLRLSAPSHPRGLPLTGLHTLHPGAGSYQTS